LQEKSSKLSLISGGELVVRDYSISAKDLDSLVKEMVGDAND
jgi:hypothetical protein